jgi:UDP-N-acetylglucosamine--N-acetylmuramyl-(pentapeptide) pyrophosphoryl-undecaprenol N-acetylglucosamine transferase
LDEEKTKNAYGAADLVISRAGGSNIFEIAASGVPAILIPLPSSAQDHQRENAYAYARAGAAEVLEQENLTPHLFLERVRVLLGDMARREKMSASAKNFSRREAADKIAVEIIKLTIAHAT